MTKAWTTSAATCYVMVDLIVPGRESQSLQSTQEKEGKSKLTLPSNMHLACRHPDDKNKSAFNSERLLQHGRQRCPVPCPVMPKGSTGQFRE
jgi:hypothetical protein